MSPSKRFLLLLIGPTLISLFAVIIPLMNPWILIADAIILLMAVIDVLTLPRYKKLTVKRKGSGVLSLGTRNPFQLMIYSRCRRPLSMEVTESFPASMDVEGLPKKALVKGRTRVSINYTVVPHRRGAFDVGHIYLRIGSFFGLWYRNMRLTLPHPMKVFPDIKVVNTYALLARRNRIDLMGFRKTRGRGSDVEFDRLRDYQPDDDFRRIDPFASARMRRLITREYEISRNQNVFFMLDCSRMMASEWDGLSNLDHSLNATLMLSYLALEAGDNVGLIAFDEQVRSFMPLSRGLRSKTAILHALYDLHLGTAQADYEGAFLELNRRVRQRSLIVLFTNIMDSTNYELLRPQLRTLSRRHFSLLLLMRDADLFEMADGPVASSEEFYQRGAAAELTLWRDRILSELQKQGGMVMDLQPAQATPELINAYLQIKADQLL